MREPVQVTFLPGRVVITAHRGDTLLDAALENGLDIEHACGGNCFCTTCQVVIVDGEQYLTAMEEPEAARLATAGDSGPRSRLACQALLLGGPVVVDRS